MKVKYEAKKMAHCIQTVVQKLYKQIQEESIIVEDIMEEHVSNIDEIIKGFCMRIEDLQFHNTSRTPLKER